MFYPAIMATILCMFPPPGLPQPGHLRQDFEAHLKLRAPSYIYIYIYVYLEREREREREREKEREREIERERERERDVYVYMYIHNIQYTCVYIYRSVNWVALLV